MSLVEARFADRPHHRRPVPPGLGHAAAVWWIRWRDVVIVLGLLAAAATVHGVNMTTAPSLVTTDDEGTYVAQAWAILNMGELAHYTYWYDHPPLGWIQLAGWAFLTDGFGRHDLAISVGREFMLVAKLAAVPLLYVLSRRIGANRFFAAAVVCLFALNPLGVYFQRLTFLDNITVPWLIAAFALAASPQKRLSAHTASAVCFAAAVLTKETIAVVLPALLYQLWQGSHPDTRRMSMAIWTTVFGAICSFYLLMAVIKNELLPGPGHVDLLYAVQWQLFERAPSGSVFDSTSAAGAIVGSWAQLDPWLIGLALLLTVPALLSRPLRPVAAAFVIMVAVMLRGGYLPQPYVICLVPFAALIVAGALGALWSSGVLLRFRVLRRQIPHSGYSWGRLLVQVPAAVAVVGLIVAVAVPQWSPRLRDLMVDDRTVSLAQSLDWLESNAPVVPGQKPATVLVSDAMWVDLEQRGYDVEWYFKVDLDPAVRTAFPNGWRDVDYVIFTNEMNEIAKSESRADMFTTLEARDNGELVAEFGADSEKIWIYRVAGSAPPAGG